MVGPLNKAFRKAWDARDTVRLDEILTCAPEVYSNSLPFPRMGWTPLHYICMRWEKDKRDVPVVICFLRHPYVVERVDSQDKYGKTPLYYACQNGFLDVVRPLLAVGADPMPLDRPGLWPSYEAYLMRHGEVVQVCKVREESERGTGGGWAAGG